MTPESANILIVKYSSLGDVINAVPAIRFLRQSRPGARLYWVLKKPYAPLFAGCGFVDGIVEFRGADFRSVGALVRKIRSLRIDLVVDLQGILKSAVIGYLSGAGVRVCFPHTREGSSVFYTEKLGVKRGGCHSVEENLSVIEGLLGKKPDGGPEFRIELDPETRREAGALLGERHGRGPIVVINPTTRWATKMWPPESFAALAGMLAAEAGASVFFTGLASDRGYIDGIIKGMASGVAVNLSGRTDIRTLAGVLELSDVVVSCDSGPMHMASALGRPVVAIFGPTDPAYTGPFSRDAVVITAGAPCAPCRKRRCDDMRCMNDITPRMVFDGMRRFLGTREGSG